MIFRFVFLREQGFVLWDEGMYLNEAVFFRSILDNSLDVIRMLISGSFDVDSAVNMIEGWPPSSAKPLVGLFICFSSFILGMNVFAVKALSAFFGVLTLIPVYLLSKRVFNKRTALIAVFFLAISPYHVFLSRIGTPETSSGFFLMMSFYLYLRSIDKDSYKDLLVSGLFAGVSFCLCYRWVVMLPFIWIYEVLRFDGSVNIKDKVKRFLVLSFAFCVVPCFCDMPYWPLRLSGFSVSFDHIDKGVFGYFDQLYYYLLAQSSAGSYSFHSLYLKLFFFLNGVAITSFCVIGSVLIVLSGKMRKWFVFIPAFILFALLSFKTRGDFIRYSSAAVPFFIIAAAHGVFRVRMIMRGAFVKRLFTMAVLFIAFCEGAFISAGFVFCGSGYEELAGFLKKNNGDRHLATINSYSEFYFGRNVASQMPRDLDEFRECVASGDYKYAVVDYMAYRVMSPELVAYFENELSPVFVIDNEVGSNEWLAMESLGYGHSKPGYFKNAISSYFSDKIRVYYLGKG